MPPPATLLPAVACGVLSVAQVVAAFLPGLRGSGRTIAARSAEKPTPVTPAGPFFAVWGPIYLSCLAFAGWLVWGVLAGDADAARVAAAAGWPAAGLFLGNTLWAAWVPGRGLDLGSVLIIVAEVACGLWALAELRALAEARPLTGLGFWLGAAPVRFLTGWATAAAWVNAASWLAGRPGDEVNRPAALNPRSAVGAAAGVGLIVISVAAAAWWGNSVAVGLAGGWALLGVAAKNLFPEWGEPAAAANGGAADGGPA